MGHQSRLHFREATQSFSASFVDIFQILNRGNTSPPASTSAQALDSHFTERRARSRTPFRLRIQTVQQSASHMVGSHFENGYRKEGEQRVRAKPGDAEGTISQIWVQKGLELPSSFDFFSSSINKLTRSAKMSSINVKQLKNLKCPNFVKCASI